MSENGAVVAQAPEEGPLRVMHLVLTLDRGGAETTLANLLRFRQSPDLAYRVVNVGRPGSLYEREVRALAAGYAHVDIRRRPMSARALLRAELAAADVAVFWLYKGCAIGTALVGARGLPRQIWCIRHAQLDRRENSASTLRAARFCARRSARAAVVLYNGDRARRVHEAFGFDPSRSCVVDNGVDLARFRPRADAKPRLAAELGVPPGGRIVLSTARFHPIKDLPTLIAALGPVLRRHPDVWAVLAGSGVDGGDPALAALVRDAGLDPARVRLIGARDDAEHLYAAADVFVLSSAGEAFPNALLEAMASGAVCVATDVGDVARIAACPGFVTAPRDARALAAKIDEALSLAPDEARAIGASNRARAEARFGMGAAVARYEDLFRREALAARAAKGA